MVNFERGDIVQVKASMIWGEIDLKCKVIEYKNGSGFPKQPTLRAMQDCGKLKKGQTFGGAVSEVVAVLSKGKRSLS